MGAHRWTMRISDADDSDLIVVESREGQVYIGRGPHAAQLHPARVSRLRRILLDAQADALQERGVW